MTSNRLAAFVSAARSLLVVQVVAALLAVGVTAWAFVEVRGLIAEREQLRARVTELEAQATQPQQLIEPVPLGPDPLMNQVLPPEVLQPEIDPVLPEAGNVATPATPSETSEPGNTATPPGRWNQRPPVTQPPATQPPATQPPSTQPPTTTRPQLDCSGADRTNQRCRPIRERPPVQQVPDRLTPRGDPLVPPQRPPTLARPQPQRPAPQTRPEPRPTVQPQPRQPIQVRPTVVRPQPQTRPQPETRPTLTRPRRPPTDPQQPSSTPPRQIVLG